MMKTISVASFVSVDDEESHNTPPTSTESAVFGSYGNTDKTDLSSSEAQKSKSEALDFDRLPIGSNCSNSSQSKIRMQSFETAATPARTRS